MPDVLTSTEAMLAVDRDFVHFELPDPPGEECGVLGIYLTESGEQHFYNQGISVKELAYKGLIAQVHRGQQNTGMNASVDGRNIIPLRGPGGPEKAFVNGNLLDALPDRARQVGGENRYTTIGGDDGALPTWHKTRSGDFALNHNGQFVNRMAIQQQLPASRREQPSDTWLFSELVAQEINHEAMTTPRLAAALVRATKIARGAFSLVGFHNGDMVGMRDPNGFRPLVLGDFGEHGWMLASERPTLEAVGANYVRKVAAGEIVVINDKDGLTSIKYAQAALRFCRMENVYLRNPEDPRVRKMRYEAGRILAREAPADIDMVISIPRSANDAAQGYADELGVPLVMAIEKLVDKKTGRVPRTFMAQGEERRRKAKTSYVLNRDLIRGKKIAVIDDSIVRNTTAEVIAQKVVGVASMVHFRSASSPVKHPCFYGVDIAKPEELIANYKNPDELARSHGLDSLAYLSEEGMQSAYGEETCGACFNGEYPTELEGYNPHSKKMLPLVSVR